MASSANAGASAKIGSASTAAGFSPVDSLSSVAVPSCEPELHATACMPRNGMLLAPRSSNMLTDCCAPARPKPAGALAASPPLRASVASSICNASARTDSLPDAEASCLPASAFPSAPALAVAPPSSAFRLTAGRLEVPIFHSRMTAGFTPLSVDFPVTLR